jgi:hypothetical protein
MDDNIKTIEDLGTLITRTMASKEDIKAVTEDVHALAKKVAEGFKRIEKLLLACKSNASTTWRRG